MKIKKLDELELIKRGNIFKHCLFTVMGMLFLLLMTLQADIVLMSQRNALALIIIFISAMFVVEMIIYGIFPLSEKRQRFIYFFMGLAGVFLIAISARELITGEYRFIEDGMLSDAGAGVIMGGLFTLILIAYAIKCAYVKSINEAPQ